MLSHDEVKNIALLARIGLTEEETEKYRHNLSDVLDWFSALKEANTEGVEPIGHITGRENSVSPDEVRPAPSSEREGILKNMPMTKDGYTKVRSVF
ncbi:MAG: Asp-tRNA(Asn)/Glu-tRNA(Gln) amidotransferase subunit GatC [Candidatus Moraniibacteriota bacterium]